MKFPYPLDDCECGHYRITHNAQTRSNGTACMACNCTQFTLRNSDEEQREVKTQT